MVKGFFPAVLATAVLPIGGFFMVLPVTRNLIAKCLPGEGWGVFVKRGGCFVQPLTGTSIMAAWALSGMLNPLTAKKV